MGGNISMLWWSLFFISSFPYLGNGGGGGGDAATVLAMKRRSHVRKEAIIETFEFAGDVIDCVDIYKQPALDHPLLKNHTIQMKPTSFPKIPRRWRAENINVSMVEGPQFSWRLPRSCPKGSIPIPRMRGGGLNASASDSIVHPRHPLAQRGIKDKKDVLTTHEYAVVAFSAPKLYGARAIINVQSPRLDGHDEFSLGQIWVASGDLKATLEAGWMVFPQMYGDYRTRLFTFWTNNGYETYCYNLQCPGFVRMNANINLGMSLEPVSTYGGQQYDIDLEIFQDRGTKNWWLRLHGVLLGYWPSSIVPQLHDGAQIHNFGGEILNKKPPGQHTGTQMGSGHFAHEGFMKSAFFKNILIANSEDPWRYTSPTRGDAYTIITHPYCYDLEVAHNVELQWGYYFFYGGPGRSASCP